MVWCDVIQHPPSHASLSLPRQPPSTTCLSESPSSTTLYHVPSCSIYYALLGAFKFESPAEIARTIRETWFQCLSAGWKLWPFAHIITYGVIPQEHRLLWVDAVEIVWVTLLSYIASQYTKKRDSPEAVAEAEEMSVAAAAAGDATVPATPQNTFGDGMATQVRRGRFLQRW